MRDTVDQKMGHERDPVPAETRERFAAWVASVGGSKAAAERLEVARSYVDMLRGGQRSPGLRTAYRIAVSTKGGIPMEAWLDAAARK